MIRTFLRRILPALLLASIALPAPARATGAWATYIRAQSCNDVLATPDTVYMATGEAGLLRYLRATDTYESVTREPGGLASNALTSLAFDRSNRLWVGTAGKGLCRLSANRKSWALVNAFDGVPSDTVTCLRSDGDTIWIGTTRGIALWNGKVVAGSIPDLGTPSPFRSNNVTGIVVWGDTLFVSTSDGIYVGRLSQNLATWTSGDEGLLDTDVKALATDGTVVLAMTSNVVMRFERGSGWVLATPFSTVRRLSDQGHKMMCATKDSVCAWGADWEWHKIPGAELPAATTGGSTAFATSPDWHIFLFRYGYLYEKGTSWWTMRALPGPPGNDVQNVLADGSGLWAATFIGGIGKWDGTSWRNWSIGCCGPDQDSSFIETSYAFTLQNDPAGHIWTSSWNSGIDRVDTRTSPYTFLHAYSGWGIGAADPRSRHTDGWSSAADSAGYVYIGGDSPNIDDPTWAPMGIDVYDTSGNPIQNWNSTNAKLSSNQVRAVAYDKLNGVVWAGFASKGVGYASYSALDSDGNTANGNDHLKVPTFSTLSSLGQVNVFGVVPHGDSLWVLGSTQLYRAKGSIRAVISTYDLLAQQAPRGAVHPLEVEPDGTVWTASLVGARRFRPGGGHDDYTEDNSPLAAGEVRSISVDRRTGYVWFATANGISRFDPNWQAPAPKQITSLQLRTWPNPALMTGLGITMRLEGNSETYSGEIVDVCGRIVRRFDAAANGDAVWDGRDEHGVLVKPGVYFVHARAVGHEAASRIVVLR